jgi:hypothetical protein
MMRIFLAAKWLCVAALVLSPVAALAQGAGAGEPRTAPPSPPARAPERAEEAPDAKAPAAPETAAPADNRSREASRCTELTGPAREQCLLERQDGAAGATSSTPEPRPAPPPQNPR